MTDWREVADRVYVLRYPVLDVNTTLIVGDGAALVVDTLATPSQARSLTEEIRRITPHPWSVVNTHHHFDHAYGNQAFGDCAIWGHEETVRQLSEVNERFLGALHDEWAPTEPGAATPPVTWWSTYHRYVCSRAIWSRKALRRASRTRTPSNGRTPWPSCCIWRPGRWCPGTARWSTTTSLRRSTTT
jgi:hypothetical protein